MTAQLFKEIFSRCAAIGAGLIETTDARLLAIEGLAVVVAMMFPQGADVSGFIDRVRTFRERAQIAQGARREEVDYE